MKNVIKFSQFVNESYFTGTGGDLKGFMKELKNKTKIGHNFEIKDNKLYFLASEDEETEKKLQGVADGYGVKIILEEYMYRHDQSTKPERYEHQRQYFVNQLVKIGCDKSKEELQKMSIEQLGKLLNTLKKEK
jgi:hypothetical protein